MIKLFDLDLDSTSDPDLRKFLMLQVRAHGSGIKLTKCQIQERLKNIGSGSSREIKPGSSALVKRKAGSLIYRQMLQTLEIKVNIEQDATILILSCVIFGPLTLTCKS